MIAKGLHTALKQDGYAVDCVGDGRSAAEALRSSRFDLVLLDLGLPERDGLEVLRELRSRGDATPVIILTARDDVQNRIAGARRRRGRLHRQAVRSRRSRGAHALGAAPCGRTRRSVHPSPRHRTRSGHARGRARRRAGRPVGARVRRARGAAAASGRGSVARAARGPAVRLGRADREQRDRGLHPRLAPQARQRCDPHAARRGLLRAERP